MKQIFGWQPFGWYLVCSPMTREEVGDLRPLLHADPPHSKMLVSSSSAPPTHFLWGLVRGTMKAVAEPLFCGPEAYLWRF